MLFLLGFMDHYRYAIRNYAQKDSISFAAIFRALEVSVERADIEGKQTTAERALARLNDLDSVAAITLWTPEIQPYLNGETYALIPAGLVPRALWPDKPVIIRPINEWFFRNEGGSSPITIVGEGYLNFGWFGVIFAGAGAALLLRSVDRYISRFAGNAAVVPVYIAFMAACAQVQNAAAVIWITTFLKFAFFATVVHLLTRPKVMPQFNDPVQLPQVQH